MENPIEKIATAIGRGRLRDAITARETIHFPGLLPKADEQLLSLFDLEEALAAGTIPPKKLRLFAGHKQVALELMGVERGGRLRLEVLKQLAKQGVTLVFNDLVPRMPKLGRIAAAAEALLGDPVELTCVVSFGETSGLALHHDVANLLIIQLEGSKRWIIAGEPIPPGTTAEAPKDDPLPVREIGTQAGDVMFMAAGQQHRAIADGYSMHLALFPHHVTGAKVLRRFCDKVSADIALNEPSAGMLGAQADAQWTQACRARLHALIDEYDIAEAMQAIRDEKRIQSGFRLR